VQVDLFEWIDGAQLGTAENGLGNNTQDIERTYRTIGNIAAQIHNHGASWSLPNGFQRHAWDAEGLVGDQPLWGRFWELETLTQNQRQLLLTARDIVRSELDALMRSTESKSHYGLIHADFVPENLLVSDGAVRVIDFDDAGFGWHLFELATALYFIRDDPNYPLAYNALIKGYREYRSLSETVLEKLPVFMVARSFTYLGWVHTRKDSETARQLTTFVTDLACDLAAEFVRAFRPVERAAVNTSW
jgi:Ser/Thr protein kinase RdoA (MazF antagonist)